MHSATFSTFLIKRYVQRRKEEPSWRLKYGESESGTRTSSNGVTDEILEAGRVGPRLCLRVTGSVDCRRCSREGPVWRRQVLITYLAFSGESAHLRRQKDGRASALGILVCTRRCSRCIEYPIIEKTIREMIDIQRTGEPKHPTRCASANPQRDIETTHIKCSSMRKRQM